MKARLIYIAVIACLVVFALQAYAKYGHGKTFPDGH
jgi:hypothetical protein